MKHIVLPFTPQQALALVQDMEPYPYSRLRRRFYDHGRRKPQAIKKHTPAF